MYMPCLLSTTLDGLCRMGEGQRSSGGSCGTLDSPFTPELATVVKPRDTCTARAEASLQEAFLHVRCRNFQHNVNLIFYISLKMLSWFSGMFVICSRSVTFGAFVQQNYSNYIKGFSNPPEIHRALTYTVLTGLPLSSSKAMTDRPTVISSDFRQITPLSKQSTFSADTLSIESILLCMTNKKQIEHDQTHQQTFYETS